MPKAKTGRPHASSGTVAERTHVKVPDAAVRLDIGNVNSWWLTLAQARAFYAELGAAIREVEAEQLACRQGPPPPEAAAAALPAA